MPDVINRRPTEVMDVYVMGLNSRHGNLCMGTGWRERDILWEPRHNRLLSTLDVVDMAIGNNHGLALTNTGMVHSWGANSSGALGREMNDQWEPLDVLDANPNGRTGPLVATNVQEPRHIDWSDIEPGTSFTQVAVSDHASFALTETGQVYGWGAFEYLHTPELWLDERPRRYSAFHPQHAENPDQEGRFQPRPLKIRFPGTEDPQIVQIACGSNHILALSKSGHVYSWGSPDLQILGRRLNFLKPRRRAAAVAAAAAAHERADAARYPDDHPYTNMHSPFAPGLVSNLKNIRYIACGAHFSFAVSKPLTRGPRKGLQVCYAWGQNDELQTALPLSKSVFLDHPLVPNRGTRVILYPEEVPWLSNIGHMLDEPETAIKQISGSIRYALAVRENGWGDAWGNEHEVPYAMGVVDGNNEPVVPAVTPGNRWGSAPTFGGFQHMREGVRWKRVATGKTHTIALDGDGRVFVCGKNDQGQCGVETGPSGPVDGIHRIRRPTLLTRCHDIRIPGVVQALEGKIAIFAGAGENHSVLGFVRDRHGHVASPEFAEGEFEVGGN
ncbi:regulator of chromosome condensation 1/beta-lactamase-inhibitor protein II [Sordaria brevicollis]|uniref:Regulator of chromosome condensation 1/beta-lactamase-inhibitor protein II n=1 Tax=Sordaria brevicollis TaxID=83679 RepID=A0AAE0P9U4_SORBR|nr:regulator of chromosome condensation 1/beta-lactamase-inhibitor protein II [Sordaria brevicollis]